MTTPSTIDLTPTPTQYMKLLQVLMENAETTSTREWAKAEYARWEKAVDEALRGNRA